MSDEASTRSSVLIVHPWMPQYRVAFFEHLVDAADRAGICIRVAYGDPPREWRARNDSRDLAAGMRLRTRFFKVLSRDLVFKSLPARATLNFDLIIVEQAIRNLESYLLIFRPKRRANLAFWGHGRTYTAPKSQWEERLKTALTRRTSWFFGYTRSGVDAVVANGFPVTRTTVVNNTIDSKRLLADLDLVSKEALDKLRSELDLTPGLTAIAIGGVDPSKRIDFLIDAANEVGAALPNFKLIIVGGGSQQSELRQRVRNSRNIIYVGPKFGLDKAVLLKEARLLMNPGRVGLIAVDSLVSGTPIVTTKWPYHAPEFDYLASGRNAIVTQDNLSSYSSAVTDALTDQETLDRMVKACEAEAHNFSIEAMAGRFLDGIKDALDEGRRTL